jgi:hypothetical protein
MSSSKVILIGAISVVFGLYTLSLTRVEGFVGNTALNISYMQRADLMARAGVQRAMHYWTTGNFVASVGPVYVGDSSYSTNFFSSYSFTASTGPGTYNIAWLNSHYGTMPVLIQLTIVSHGLYKGPGEPAAFAGHEVIRTAYAEFVNTDIAPVGNPDPHWFDIKFKWVRDSVNYTHEHELDSLQQFTNY